MKIKRVYEKPEKSDGYRVLVDRLWPRGVSKARAQVDLWLKEVGPSDGLREWFGHDPAKFQGFKKMYELELTTNPAVTELQKVISAHKATTLVYSAKDEQHNQAVVLRDFLMKN